MKSEAIRCKLAAVYVIYAVDARCHIGERWHASEGKSAVDRLDRLGSLALQRMQSCKQISSPEWR